MDGATEPSADPVTRPGSRPDPTPRQRWRLTLACAATAADLASREVAEAWEAALDATTLPLLRVGRGPARIAFAAARPAGMPAEAEPADIVLAEVWPVWRVRDALSGHLPDGWRLVALEDAWLGEPPIAAQASAALYRVVLRDDAAIDATRLHRAARTVLDAPELWRERAKGSGTVAYDLRPLLLDADVLDPGPPVVLRIRTRLHPTLGSGRPEAVVAAIGEAAGLDLVTTGTTRERVFLGNPDTKATDRPSIGGSGPPESTPARD